MGAAKKAETLRPTFQQLVAQRIMDSSKAARILLDGPQLSEAFAGFEAVSDHDPLLRRLQTPKEMHAKNWQEVAESYLATARQYARENDRHIAELLEQAKANQRWKIDQLERSTRQYDRLSLEIKSRDAEIDQLIAMIHLLTKAGR